MRYLDTPPSPDELDELCRMLGVEPTALVRVKDRRYRELGLSLDEPRSRDEWLRILSSNPSLLERPIVVRGRRAVVGRPTEKLLELFEA